jgi:hypothetical protein
MVARRIRIALQHWDQMKVAFQEQVIGRHKRSGAPLGQKDEFAPLDLDATDADGNPVIPANAHARLGAPEMNGGVEILRRSVSYSDGVSLRRNVGRPGGRPWNTMRGYCSCAIRRIPTPRSSGFSGRCPGSMRSTNLQRMRGAGFSLVLRVPRRAGISARRCSTRREAEAGLPPS